MLHSYLDKEAEVVKCIFPIHFIFSEQKQSTIHVEVILFLITEFNMTSTSAIPENLRLAPYIQTTGN